MSTNIVIATMKDLPSGCESCYLMCPAFIPNAVSRPKRCPLVKVKPRAKARWIKEDEKSTILEGVTYHGYRCSNCNYYTCTDNNYCGRCGMRMSNGKDPERDI